MSYQLNILLYCDTPQLAATVVNLIARDTRPDFEEDVPDDQRELYAVIERIEFPNEIQLDRNRVLLHWMEQEDIQFHHLKPLFAAKGIDLIAGFEIPDYVDDEDAQWFWVATETGYQQLWQDEASRLLDPAVIEQLRQ